MESAGCKEKSSTAHYVSKHISSDEKKLTRELIGTASYLSSGEMRLTRDIFSTALPYHIITKVAK